MGVNNSWFFAWFKTFNKLRFAQHGPGPLYLVLMGLALGSGSGYSFGRLMAIHSAESVLSQSATDLVERGDALFRDLYPLFLRLSTSTVPFCSDAELQQLRTLTFRSFDLKDIGRTRDGKLYCSAFLGRLATPYNEGTPTLRMINSTNIYSNVGIVLASSNGDHGTVIESQGVDVVLDTASFQRGFHTNARYQVVATDRMTRRFATIAGSSLIPSGELPAQSGFLHDSSTTSYSTCSTHYPLCVIVRANTNVLLRGYTNTRLACSILGSLTGLSAALTLTFLFTRYTRLAHRLHRAIRKRARELTLVYQPILDINSQRCIGGEALIRWTDHHGEPVSPEIFVAAAEQEGFVIELTAFVMERAIQDLGDHLRGNRGFTLSLNIAASDLSKETFFDLLEEHIVNRGILPEQIALELTERSTSDLDEICEAVKRLRSRGFKVHIDDFGTGYSNFSYLVGLDVNAVKIDRSFTRTIGTGAVTSSLLPQMLAMAKDLNVEVIVEGVENKPQSDYLIATGENLMIQGWHIARPMNAAAFLAFEHAADTSILVEHPDSIHPSPDLLSTLTPQAKSSAEFTNA